MRKKRPISMHSPSVVWYQLLVTVRPAKAEPLLLRGRGEGVDDLGEAVGPVVEPAGQRRLRAAPTAPAKASTATGMARM